MADWPAWTPEASARRTPPAAYPRRGDTRRVAADHARAGRHVVISTGTASGKSLAFQLPALAAVDRAPRRRRRSAARPCSTSRPPRRWPRTSGPALRGLALDLRVSTHDGDSTPRAARLGPATTREYVLTNPDMLHRSLLPGHERWSRFFGSLRYRRGRRVPPLPRRLRRPRRPGAAAAAPGLRARTARSPTFVLASATMADPAGHGRAGSPGCRWRRSPTTARPGAGSRWRCGSRRSRSVRRRERRARAPLRRPAEAADLLTDLVVERRPDPRLRPVPARRRSRSRCTAGELLGEVDPSLADRVAAYRGGYLPEERRELEERAAARSSCSAWRRPTPSSSASTSAASTRCCWPASPAPGRRCGSSSAGPAGARATRSACWSPATTRSTPTWCTTRRPCSAGRSRRPSSTPTTPTCSGRTCARPPRSSPLTEADLPLFGPDQPHRSSTRSPRPGCCAGGRAAGSGPTGAGPPTSPTSGRPAVRRCSCSRPSTGRVRRDRRRRRRPTRTAHAGAVYLHPGETWLVRELDLDEPGRRRRAHATPATPPRPARSPRSSIDRAERRHDADWGELPAGLGDVRRDPPGGLVPQAAPSRAAR